MKRYAAPLKPLEYCGQGKMTVCKSTSACLKAHVQYRLQSRDCHRIVKH